MALKVHKPRTPGRRFMSVADFSTITRTRPEKRLLRPIKKKGGRNFQGVITARHRGGGHKRRYRLIDFKRDKLGVPARVASIEYDPNRSTRIALLYYRDGEKRYILAPLELRVGDSVVSDENAELRPGNSLPLRNIPAGMPIHNIELQKGRGGQLVRAAGGSAALSAKEGKYGHLTLPSGEIRRVPLDCKATIGQLSNAEHSSINLGKAGRRRWLGRRPHVRGTAMNPVAHPHGGGEGRTKGGRQPVSPTGKPAKGGKTRRPKATSNKYIVRRRRGRTRR